MAPQSQWLWGLGIYFFLNLDAVGTELHFKILQQSVKIKKNEAQNHPQHKKKWEKSAQ